MPSTIREALAEATGRLTTAGVDAPKLVAQVLLAHALGVPRDSVLISPPHHVLQPHQIVSFRALVARCVEGEPMAYVVGHTEFYALEFQIDRRALIPRPETEQLVELALRRLEVLNLPPQTLVVDVGTGSGCIVVSLAVKLSNVRFMATDISSDALALAHDNAKKHKVNSRIQFLRGDLLAPVPVRADGVVANLPYVTTAEWQSLPHHIRNHEPRTALDGGADGLDFIRRLLSQASKHVKPDGWLLLEIGSTQGPAVSALARQAFPMAAVNLHRDLAGLTRVVEIQLRAVPGVKLR